MFSIPRTVLLPLLLSGVTSAFAASQTTPDRDFKDNGDGTVTHTTTGLTWKRCAEGQTWSNNTCVGVAGSYAFDAATKLTSTFAGKTDWRVPNVAELKSIVEREKRNPAVNQTMFPNGVDGVFWSSSKYHPIKFNEAPLSTNKKLTSWAVDFRSGDDALSEVTDTYAVRLVSGAGKRDATGAYAPTADFTDLGNGTVTHKLTGLTWQRCPAGQTYVAATGAAKAQCTGTATQSTYDAATKLTSNFAGQVDWRLPTANELATIAEYNDADPAINSAIFPSAATKFWSSSQYMALSTSAWSLDFFIGADSGSDKTELKGALFVRGGAAAVPGTDKPFEYPENANYSQADQGPLIAVSDVIVGSDRYEVFLLGNKELTTFTVFTAKITPFLHKAPATYNLTTNILSLPRVKVGNDIYTASMRRTSTDARGFPVFALVSANKI